jgi:hypothetical protein
MTISLTPLLYQGEPDETQTRQEIAIVEKTASGRGENAGMKQNCHFSRTDPFPG